MVPECKPEWNREAITVFSRLPSLRRLQTTPQLQTSLVKVIKNVEVKKPVCGCPLIQSGVTKIFADPDACYNQRCFV